MRTKQKPIQSATTKRRYNLSETLCSYAMITPQIIGFAVFLLYPMLWVYRYAFYDYDGITATFVGLDNFIRVFTRDSKYWMSILNTVIIAYGKLIIEFPLALLVAVAVNQKFRGRVFFRVMFYLPNVVSTAVVGLIFCFLFSSYNGAINNLLIRTGIIEEAVNWFGHKWTAMSVIMLASIWQSFGHNMLFLLAGLQGIPAELYEAAQIDGAKSWAQFRHITLPMLKPVLQVLLMLSIIYGMQIMDSVMVITNGAPAGETDVVMLYIYRFFFEAGSQVKQWGYASALGVVTSLIICAVTLIYMKVSEKSATIY